GFQREQVVQAQGERPRVSLLGGHTIGPETRPLELQGRLLRAERDRSRLQLPHITGPGGRRRAHRRGLHSTAIRGHDAVELVALGLVVLRGISTDATVSSHVENANVNYDGVVDGCWRLGRGRGCHTQDEDEAREVSHLTSLRRYATSRQAPGASCQLA